MNFRLSGAPPAAWLGLVASVVVVAAATLLVYPLKDIAPAVSLGVVYIPGVLLISTVWGLRLGLLTALLSAAAFNWFHLPPIGRARHRRRSRPRRVGRSSRSSRSPAAPWPSWPAPAPPSPSAGAKRPTGRWPSWRSWPRERDRMQAEAIEAEALRRSDELKTSLLRSVSHDLRTPLTSIIAAGAALDSPSATAEERHELSEAVVEQGQRLSRLVENLLDVSRLETGHAEPRREPVDLPGLLEAARHSLGARGEPVRLALDAELPALSADPTQLERAFANLLENARRPRRGASRSWSARGWSGRGSWSGSSTAGRGSPRASASGSSSPSTARAGRRQRAQRLGPRPGDRPGLRRGQRRRDRGRVAAGPGQQLRRQLRRARRRPTAERERAAAHPRLRRRAADPAGAEGDPARRRLRGGDRRARGGGARPRRRANRPRRRSST